MILRQAYFGPKLVDLVMRIYYNIYDSLLVWDSGMRVSFVNINLENYARQDRLARVTGATVAEAMDGGHATGSRA